MINQSNVKAKAIAKRVKDFFNKAGMKVSVKTLTTAGKTERPIWIQVCLERSKDTDLFAVSEIPNNIRLMALKASNVALSSVLNLNDISYGNIQSTRISLSHINWEKLLKEGDRA